MTKENFIWESWSGNAMRIDPLLWNTLGALAWFPFINCWCFGHLSENKYFDYFVDISFWFVQCETNEMKSLD